MVVILEQTMILSDWFYCYFSNYCRQLLPHSTLCTLCHFIISTLQKGDSVHLDDEMKESEIGECGWRGGGGVSAQVGKVWNVFTCIVAEKLTGRRHMRTQGQSLFEHLADIK